LNTTSETRPPGAQILIVDDNKDAAESLAMLLEILGYKVSAVYDGETALDAARTTHPDVIFLDIGLPGIDGHEVARRLRTYPELAGSLLIAMTGFGSPADKERSRAAGFNHHLIKPVEVEVLEEILGKI
jgi:CheY-like chemotaxis protein